MINRYFLVSVTHPKGGQCFGPVRRIISSMKRRTTNILDYVGLIINYLRNSRAGGLERNYMFILI